MREHEYFIVTRRNCSNKVFEQITLRVCVVYVYVCLRMYIYNVRKCYTFSTHHLTAMKM